MMFLCLRTFDVSNHPQERVWSLQLDIPGSPRSISNPTPPALCFWQKDRRRNERDQEGGARILGASCSFYHNLQLTATDSSPETR